MIIWVMTIKIMVNKRNKKIYAVTSFYIQGHEYNDYPTYLSAFYESYEMLRFAF